MQRLWWILCWRDKIVALCLKEHQRAVFIRDKNTSALTEHVLDTGHTIDWDNASVMVVCNNYNKDCT